MGGIQIKQRHQNEARGRQGILGRRLIGHYAYATIGTFL